MSKYGLSLLLFFQIWALSVTTFAQKRPQSDFEIFAGDTLFHAQDIEAKILKNFPVQNYHYIFIGRSLSLIRALLEVHKTPSTGLPLSGKSIDLSFNYEAGPQMQKSIMLHLQDYLPSRQELTDKQILVLDFSVSGNGLKTAIKVLNWYYKGQVKINRFEISTRPLRFLSRLKSPFLKRHYHYKIDSRSMFYTHLINSNFDSYAGYGKFNLNSGFMLKAPTDSESNYQGLKAWLKTKVAPLKSTKSGLCLGFLSARVKSL